MEEKAIKNVYETATVDFINSVIKDFGLKIKEVDKALVEKPLEQSTDGRIRKLAEKYVDEVPSKSVQGFIGCSLLYSYREALVSQYEQFLKWAVKNI